MTTLRELVAELSQAYIDHGENSDEMDAARENLRAAIEREKME